ncbi:leucine-rich repeat neuronal protein 4 [Rhynchocyon petersi]
MCWALLLLLPPALLSSPSGAGPTPERAPLLRVTRRGPPAGGETTASPCEGLSVAEPTALSLANRSLEHLPGCLPPALRSLDGSHNLLRALDARNLSALPRLQALSLSHNRIAELRWGPGAPESLHTLDLSHNRLAALPRCAAEPALRRLHTLHLAGNPLRTLPRGAFSCFPALHSLNLSATALGSHGREAIAEAAFTAADGTALDALEILDLSGTFLTRIQSEWIGDLPNLTSLYLRNMPRLKTLEEGIFKMVPNLQQLDCQDSPALTMVHTHTFEDTPHLQALLFENCNLSTFPPWTLNSSQALSINLFSNPLICSCELSWLLSDAKRIVLTRAADTMCAPAADSQSLFPAPLPLSQLPGVCQSVQNATLVASIPPSSNHTTHVGLASPRGHPTQPSPSPSPYSPPGGGRHSVTKATSLDMTHTPATGPPSSALEGAPHSPTIPTAGYNSSLALRALGTPRTQHSANGAVAPGSGPHTPAVPTPFTKERPGSSPNSRNPVTLSQPIQGAPGTQSPSEEEIPVLLLDDDDEEEEGVQTTKPAPQDLNCDYHPCKHLETPCAEMQKRQRCRCPGLSGEDVVPDPPRLQGVLEVTDTSALVHWCAPNSVVRDYQVRYHPDGQPEAAATVGPVHATARLHPLSGLKSATTYRVCVLAANRAGLSGPPVSQWRRPCATFTTRPSPTLALATLGASCALLFVCTLVLAACLCHCARAPRPEHPRTHLVAYKNPAFDVPPKAFN